MFVSALAIGFSLMACLEWAFREWEGVLNKVFKGRLRPEVQPVNPLKIIFERKRTPFVYLPLTNGTPFTYLI